ncbi:MAG: hypothetical protein CVV42_16505, partial [Candidatus Riflebacteria bacterium HGW-Riflebacteria-2]
VPVRVDKVGVRTLTVKAIGTEKSDAVARMVRVVPDGKEFAQADSGSLSAGSVSHTPQFPANAVEGSPLLFLNVYPAFLSQAVEGLDSMLQEPYGCFEQTTSTTWPNVLVLSYMLASGQITPEIQMKAESLISTGYQRLLTFEHPGGGFSWFGTQDPAPYLSVTAFGVMEFADMAKVHDLDDTLIPRTTQWLASQQKPDGSWEGDQTEFFSFHTSALRNTAFVTWSLGTAGYTGPEMGLGLSFIKANLNKEPSDAYTLGIVANALESLCEYERPEIEDKLIDFATSSDNRIRANAVKGLHKYSPKLAESHIAEMVKSQSIALQDSGVYLLRTLRPANLSELLPIAQHSRYATVRLKTLDIMPPTSDEKDFAEMMQKEELEKPDPRRDLILLTFFLGLGIALLLLADPSHKRLLSLFFLIISSVTLLSHEKTRTSIQKTALSMGFISSLAWGNTRLMVLPTLMGLWLTWNNQQLNRLGKIEKAPPQTVYAWFFAIGAIIIHQVTQDELSMTFGLISKLGAEGLRLPQVIADMASRQSRFELAIFAIVSLMTILILKLNVWFPPKSLYENPKKRLFVTTIVCLAVLMLLNLFHFWGLKLQMKISGINSHLAILKQLQP